MNIIIYLLLYAWFDWISKGFREDFSIWFGNDFRNELERLRLDDVIADEAATGLDWEIWKVRDSFGILSGSSQLPKRSWKLGISQPVKLNVVAINLKREKEGGEGSDGNSI